GARPPPARGRPGRKSHETVCAAAWTSLSRLSSVLLAPPADKLTRDAAIAIMHAASSRSFEMLGGSEATSEIGRVRLFRMLTPVGFELGPFLGRELSLPGRSAT